MKLWPLLFNITSLQGNALSPSLFELSYPFKIEGFFLVPQGNIEPSPFLIIGQHLRHPSYDTFDIPKMSVRIDCTAPKLMPTSLAMLRRSRLLSHINSACTTMTFSSVVASLGHLSIILNALSPSLKLGCPFFHCAIRRRLLPNGFHEVFMNFFGRHSFLTEVLDNRSDFKFLHFANDSHHPLLKVILIQWISQKHIGLRTCWPHLVHKISWTLYDNSVHPDSSFLVLIIFCLLFSGTPRLLGK